MLEIKSNSVSKTNTCDQASDWVKSTKQSLNKLKEKRIYDNIHGLCKAIW